MKLRKDNYVIGITGGVGAGKSMVLYFLENEHAAAVYQADRIAGSLTAYEGRLQKRIRDIFGEEVVMQDGSLSRKKISEIIYNDPVKYKQMNDIVHPIVKRFLSVKANNMKGLVILEAALPIEAGFDEICDEIWYIHSDKEKRIQRLFNKRLYSKEHCEKIIANQISDEEFRKIADREINNNGDFFDTEKQVAKIIEELKAAGLPVEGGYFNTASSCNNGHGNVKNSNGGTKENSTNGAINENNSHSGGNA